jgi:hypothetical protein
MSHKAKYSSLAALILMSLIASGIFYNTKVSRADDDDGEESDHRPRTVESVPTPAPAPTPTPTPVSAPVPTPVPAPAAITQQPTVPAVDYNQIIQDTLNQERQRQTKQLEETVNQERQKLEAVLAQKVADEKKAKTESDAFIEKLLTQVNQLENKQQPKLNTVKTSTPKRIISQPPAVSLPVIPEIVDSDNDGVIDQLDQHPNEDDLAYLVEDKNVNGIADDLDLKFLIK